MSDSDAMAWATQAGFAYPGNGTAYFRLDLPTGAVATLSQTSGRGPVYADADGNPSLTLTSAVGIGASSTGVAWFGNVAPGPFTISVTEAGQTCDQGTAPDGVIGDWLGPTKNSLAGETVAGSMTVGLSMFCH